jgi:putative protease
LCKGRFVANGEASYLFEEPVSLNASKMLPELMAAGVTALKIEGRQRGRGYVSQAVAAFRRAVDAAARGAVVDEGLLDALSESGRGTTGAYEKRWR